MTAVKVPKTPTKKGRCPVRPKVDGSQGNPMAVCTFTKGHDGKHSWEKSRFEVKTIVIEEGGYCVNVIGDDGDVEAWLDVSGCVSDGIVVGVGPTQKDALVDAMVTLRCLADALEEKQEAAS